MAVQSGDDDMVARAWVRHYDNLARENPTPSAGRRPASAQTPAQPFQATGELLLHPFHRDPHHASDLGMAELLSPPEVHDHPAALRERRHRLRHPVVELGPLEELVGTFGCRDRKST